MIVRALLLLLACGAAPPSIEAPPAPPPAEATAEAAPLDTVVRVLGRAPRDAKLPTVVAIHGLGDLPERFLGLFDGFDPGEAAVRVIAPRAPLPWGKGTSWYSGPAMKSDPATLAAELTARADQVAALIRAEQAAGHVDGPVLVTGFSQGGMLSFTLAVTHPELVAEAVPLAGFLPVRLVPDPVTDAHRATPIRAHHGTADDRLPFAWAKAGVDALKAAGMDATLTPWDAIGHAVPAGMQRALFDEVSAHITRP